MRLHLGCVLLLLLFSMPKLFGQNQLLQDPDPTSPTYAGSISSQFTSSNARGTGSATVASVRAGASTAVLGSSSYSYGIPVLHLPGRDGLDLDLSLYYNSDIWTQDSTSNAVIFNADRDWPSYGFRLDFGLLISDSTGYYLIESDGTKHILSSSGSGVYNSTDSSYINLNLNTGGSGIPVVTYKGGTQLSYQRYPSTPVDSAVSLFRPTRISDTQGNFISITYVSGTDQFINNITDTLGRVIQFNYNGSGLLSSITSNGGTRTWASFSWNAAYVLNYHFTPAVHDSPSNGATLSVLSGITLPNGSGYGFSYGSWGIVNQITNLSNSAQTRGYQGYDYPGTGVALAAPPTYTHQTVFDGAASRSWVYSNVISNGVVGQSNITDPGGATTSTNLFTSATDWKLGLVSSVQIKDSANHVLREVDNTWGADTGTNANPRITSALSILSDTGQQSRTDLTYDGNGNVTDEKDYDYGLTLKREVVRQYSTAFTSSHILDKLTQIIVKDSAGNNISRTDFNYGDTVNSPAITGAAGHNDSYTGSRANLLSVTRFTNPVAGTGPITRNFNYDSLGNLTRADLDCCVQKQWVFSSTTQYSYPDSVVRGPAGGPQLTFAATYNLESGTIATATDENLKVAQFTYDGSNRLHTVTQPDGVLLTYSYDDASVSPSVSTSNSADNAIEKKIIDGMGRPLQNQLFNGASIVFSKDVQYDDIARQVKTSNPYIPGYETPVWTTTQFDFLDRPTSTATLTGGSTQYSYSGNATTTTDPAGKLRRTINDPFGQLSETDEPDVVTSQNSANYLTLQTDGNFVLYNPQNQPLWSTMTWGTTDGPAYVEDDGDLVLYQFRWSAGTYRFPNGTTIPPVWCSVGDTLYVGQMLTEGQCLVSKTGMTFAQMNNGELQIYDYQLSQLTWVSSTYGHPGGYAVMQADGRLVIYSATNTQLWSSPTSGTGVNNVAILHADGRLIVNSVAWSTNTSQGLTSGGIAHPTCDIGNAIGATGIVGPGGCVVSTNGHYELLVQTDGNLVLYNRAVSPMQVLWQTGTATTPLSPGVALATLYSYDPLGNLTNVAQGAQSRHYAYDALGRMTSSTLPESGTTNFTYTDFSALNTRTDARGVITTFGYDGLHRLTSVAYNVGTTGVPATASVAYQFGTSTTANNNGRLYQMTDGTGSETYTYDSNLGRVAQVSKVIGGTTYNLGYHYDSAGNLDTLTYPSGRVVNQAYDAIGRMTQISSGGVNYVSQMAYNSAQLPVSFTYGNGVQASFGYNDHLQLASLGYVSGTNSLLSLSYNYLDANGHNNGQIQSITDARGPAFSTSYSYDLLDRLQQAQTNDLTAANTWKLAWTYDRYGNRLSQTLTGGTMSVGQPQLTVDSVTNRVNSSGFIYDSNGNLTQDGLGSYAYDADNRMTQSVVSAATSSYAYDGKRLRVGKDNSTYIFSGSKVVAEYASGALSKEYIYSGSKLIATLNGTNMTYHHGDHLSNRVETDTTGNVVRTYCNLPFGDTWYETGTPDKWKFTTYERDQSGRDYAMNRYYSNAFGRFVTADLLAGSAGDPQSLNRYSYVGNDPVNSVDPDGLAQCNFNIKLQNDGAKLTDSQIAEIKARINQIFSATSDMQGNSVSATFDSSQKTDYTLHISPDTREDAAGLYSHAIWPFNIPPTIYAGTVTQSYRYYPDRFGLVAGAVGAHELYHNITQGNDEPYWGNANLMTVDSATDQAERTKTPIPGLSQDPMSPGVNGFAKLDPDQIKSLFKKCLKKHPPAKNKGGGGPIRKKVVEPTPVPSPIDTGCEPDDDCDHQLQRIGPPKLKTR